MFPSNIQHSIFVKVVTVCIWLHILVGLKSSEVNGASLVNRENAKEITDSCKSVCNSPICKDQAKYLKNMLNEAADPCHDFYSFACDHFEKKHPISDSSMLRSAFSESQEFINANLLKAINNSDTRYPKAFTMMQNYYQSCISQATLGKHLTTLFNIFENIGGFPILLGDNWDEAAYDWKEALYKLIDRGIHIKFPFFIEPFHEHSNTTRDIPMVMSAPTAFKNSSLDDILNHSSSTGIIVLQLGASRNLSKEDIYKDLVELIDFEIDLSNITSSYEEISKQTTQDKFSKVKSLSQKFPNIPWLGIFNRILNRYNISIDSSDDIILQDKNFINRLEKFINDTPKRTIANYMAWCVVSAFYPYLTYEKNPFKRQQFCLSEVKTKFSIAVDALYVREYMQPLFHEKQPEDIENIMQNIKNQMKAEIKKAEWMDDFTRKAALKKLNKMRISSGYDRELLDDDKINEYYDKLEFKSDSFLENSISLSDFLLGNQLKTLNEPYEDLSWTMRDSAVDFNAAYKYFKNRIDVPAGFFQEFMYKYGRPNYLNYGALGSIIGHEITHGFDKKGIYRDGNGFTNQVVSSVAEKKFLDKAQCFVDQYSNFSYNSGPILNGEKTLNENIADNGGFKLAYNAYTRWIEQNDITEECLPDLNYTPKQLFWIKSAMNWCSNDGLEYTRNRILTEAHTPDPARVLIAYSNMDEFAKDFKCEPGSRMNPIYKCHLW